MWGRLLCWILRHRWGKWGMVEVSEKAFDMVIACKRCDKTVRRRFDEKR
jgi:hypothetical protein